MGRAKEEKNKSRNVIRNRTGRAAASVCAALFLLLSGCLLASCGRYDIHETGTGADAGTSQSADAGADHTAVNADAGQAGTGGAGSGTGYGTGSAAGSPTEAAGTQEPEPYIPTTPGKPWINSMLAGELDLKYKPGPEEDFFCYVNRNWLANARLWPGYGMNVSLMENMFTVQERLQLLLEADDWEQAGPDPALGHDADLARTLYRLCLDWEGRDAAGTAQLEEHMKLVDDIESLEGLTKYLLSEEPDFWGRSLVSTVITANPGNAASYVLEVDASSIFLNDSADYKDPGENGRREKEQVEKIVLYMLGKLGYGERAEEILRQCFVYEETLAEMVPTRAESAMPGHSARLNNVLKRTELAAELAHFPLQRLLDARGFGSTEYVLVMLPDALRRVDEMYIEENLEYMKSYLLAHIAYSSTDVLTEEIFREIQKIRQEMSGSGSSPTDADLAYDLVKRSLPSPLAHMYTAVYCTEEERERVRLLTERIIAYYEEMLSETEWLSEETREKAVEKLQAIRIFAVYPDAWQDYSGLKLKSKEEGGTFLEALETINHYNLYYNGGQLKQSVEREYWPGCIDTNAYYNAIKNSIYICAGFIGDLLYYDGIPDEELYAGLGSVIGHEISHAFDTSGAQFDKDGNFRNWWSDEDYQRFLERARKLADYYDGLDPLENGEHVPGNLLQAEVTADMGGVKAVLGLGRQQKDFDYDLFFRSYARIWRGIYSREQMVSMLATDSHPPGYLRVNVTLMQFDEFYKTYGIRPGDRMYMAPEERIAIW